MSFCDLRFRLQSLWLNLVFAHHSMKRMCFRSRRSVTREKTMILAQAFSSQWPMYFFSLSLSHFAKDISFVHAAITTMLGACEVFFSFFLLFFSSSNKSSIINPFQTAVSFSSLPQEILLQHSVHRSIKRRVDFRFKR